MAGLSLHVSVSRHYEGFYCHGGHIDTVVTVHGTGAVARFELENYNAARTLAGLLANGATSINN